LQIRNRIKELRYVRAGDLRPNPKNWRSHPQAQRDALRGMLAEVGIVDALAVRELDDGSLEIIDGHLRAEITPDEMVPVLVLDVDAAEADKVLATFDPLSAMAEANRDALAKLVAGIEIKADPVAEMLKGILGDAAGGTAEAAARGAPELEISAELFERQDYILVIVDNQFDWQVLCDRLEIKTVGNRPSAETSTLPQKGLGRVITAKRLLKAMGIDG
jgi:hypothetical protein